MTNVKGMSMAELRNAVLTGNETAFDEMIARMDEEKDEAVKKANYEVFMKERASFNNCLTNTTCKSANAFLIIPQW